MNIYCFCLFYNVVLHYWQFLICFSAPDSPETIELEINTVSEDGLILWQGVVCLYTKAPYWILGHMRSGSKINNIYWPKIIFSVHEIALYILYINIFNLMKGTHLNVKYLNFIISLIWLKWVCLELVWNMLLSLASKAHFNGCTACLPG